MIDVKFLNIDNAKLIGRLLPFWLRGKRIALFLLAVLNPLVSLHNRFKVWALEQYIAANITSQRLSIEWYLNYKLRSHFADPNDSFEIICDIGGQENILHSNKEWWKIDLYTSPVFSNDDGDDENGMIIYFKGEVEEFVKTANIYCPKIINTINYTYENYYQDIRAIFDKFMTSFRKYNIKVK